jgi:hypothetical protein
VWTVMSEVLTALDSDFSRVYADSGPAFDSA